MHEVLSEWMKKNYMTDTAMAARVSALSKETISKQNIRAWRVGLCKPSLPRRPILEKATKGQVKADKW